MFSIVNLILTSSCNDIFESIEGTLTQLSSRVGFFEVTVSCREVSENLISRHSEKIIEHLEKSGTNRITPQRKCFNSHHYCISRREPTGPPTGVKSQRCAWNQLWCLLLCTRSLVKTKIIFSSQHISLFRSLSSSKKCSFLTSSHILEQSRLVFLK